MQLHRSVHTFRQLEWLPQKAQRFIRFAPLLSVKLFRKLFALENAKVNKYAPRFWPISICHNPFFACCLCLLQSLHFGCHLHGQADGKGGALRCFN